jgi:hypothetical protein
MSFLLFIFHFIKAMVDDSSSSIVIYPLYHLVWEVVAKWGPMSKKRNDGRERNKVKNNNNNNKKEGKIDGGSQQQPGRCNLFWVLAGHSCFHSAIFSD